MNYRWWQAEICKSMYSSRPPKENPSRLNFFLWFVGVVFGHKFKILFRHFIRAREGSGVLQTELQ